MQKRSPEKITFPNFWANTCCSHPLFVAEEMEKKDHMGVKNAARRKVYQELGIPPEDLPLDCFEFLTKVHYKAKSDDVWGEHEIDYILFCRPPSDVIPKPNPNEVAEARFFSMRELQQFVNNSDSNGDLISPWFRFIHNTLLPNWWKALLDGKLDSVKEHDKIYRAGLAANHGGKISASAISKQGAYGKVQIHKESRVAQIFYFKEMYAMLCLKYKMHNVSHTPPSKMEGSSDLQYCDQILEKTSRSFTAVIRQLPDDLRACVCVFYLVLRGLDTIEDDMESFPNSQIKVAQLVQFYEHLNDPNWSLSGVGFGDEATLLQNFDKVIRTLLSLPVEYQKVICDITKRMGKGMSEFVEKDMQEGTVNIAEYNLYCYYVAGLVGEGLSSLFAISGCEETQLGGCKRLSHSMGLFLQKTNIIRDYLEDHVDGRAFWPKEIWGKYVQNLGDFRSTHHREASVQCLNELVTDALEHIPDCLEYLSMLRDEQIFQFCAIPQLMAIATLEKVYNNPLVFTGVVKIRKGLAARLVLESSDMECVQKWFLRFARSIASRIPSGDPNALRTNGIIRKLEKIVIDSPHMSSRFFTSLFNMFSIFLFGALLSYLYVRSKERGSFFPPLTDTVDVFLLGVMFTVISSLFGFTGVAFVLGSAPKERTDKSVSKKNV